MFECQLAGVKPRAAGITDNTASAVYRITDDRMIDRTHVDAYLMGSTGLERHGQERRIEPIPRSQPPIMGDR